MTPLHRVLLSGSVGALALLASGFVSARALSLEDRVEAQRAIEGVYWEHRIWPKENPEPKPALSSVLDDASIRARVSDYLRKSNALATWWGRPITAAQLQAEMDRMAASSRAPDVLRELFAALGNDPGLIAETLARQTLADRLIRGWYEHDSRFHREQRAQAEAALRLCSSPGCMKALGGDYHEVTTEGTEELDALASAFGTTIESIPTMKLSPLEENSDAFVVRAVLARRTESITVATVAWPKRSFDAWWEANARREREDDAASSTFMLPDVPVTGCTNNTWTATRQGSTDKRRNHTAVWTGTEMIVWGGETSPGTVLATGGRYNPATDSWRPTSLVGAPQARSGHTAVWTGTEMIIWGGGSNLAAGARYNPTTDLWIRDQAVNYPEGRANHTAVWTGTEMVVWGGSYFVSGMGTHFLNSGGRYNPLAGDLNAWTPASTAPGVPEARHLHSAVWTGSKMIVWGGEGPTAGNYLGTGALYDPANDTWAPTSAGPTARRSHKAVWTGSRMIVWGGQNGNAPVGTGSRYDPANDTWADVSTATPAPSARFSHEAIWDGAEMIVWGGTANGAAYTNTGGRYDPVQDAWTATSVGPNVPTARFGFTAVWSGSEVIVWGGNQPGGGVILNTGSRYSPAGDSWVPVGTDGSPEGRSSHTSVWTGSEMIVWGGFTNGNVNTGGRYNPATDNWTATGTGANVPTPRRLHTAVWTGSEMIVFGGIGASTFADGGRYQPTTDTWTPLPPAPSGRSAHTAIWTGTEMIVWGGVTDAGLTATGSRYTPGGGWTPTSIAPGGGLFAHTAVWTGTEMIVWGGLGCTGTPFCTTGTGRRYSPAGDSWTLIPGGGSAPVARSGHTAVWTGSEMIIWGGYWTQDPTPVHILNDGGRYTPSTGGWVATSTGTNVPLARRWHTATWTGIEMIIWGGENNGARDTGARYAPGTDSWSSMASPGPTARSQHTAAWSGSEVIVWGGSPVTPSGGRYCACPNGHTVYRDGDGDGYGETAKPGASLCDGSLPAGYAESAGDCNDADASVHPNAVEINDGLDNQCAGDAGYGLIDEISGLAGFFTPGDKTMYSWPAQAGAASYAVARSTQRDFSAECSSFASIGPSIVDGDIPGDDSVFYYLVRSTAPHVGSWGQRSNGSPRTGGCLSP